jgi:hypothetical protein
MAGLPEEITTKTALLDEILTERKLFETSVDRIGEKLGVDQLVLPILHDHWSVKDTYAHITEWELAMIRCLNNSLRGRVPERPPFGLSEDQVHQTNIEYYQKNRRKSLGHVLDESQDSFELVLQRIRLTKDSDLFDPGRFIWLEGRPFWPIITANTSCHYKEHRLILQKLLK